MKWTLIAAALLCAACSLDPYYIGPDGKLYASREAWEAYLNEAAVELSICASDQLTADAWLIDFGTELPLCDIGEGGDVDAP